jgi:hypothetical protein
MLRRARPAATLLASVTAPSRWASAKSLDGCFEAIEALLGARLSLRQLFETLLRARLRLSQLGYCLSEPIEILTGDPNLFDPVIYYSDNGSIELRCDPLGSQP